MPELSSGVIVKASPIHGRGLYAARPFKKGEVVLQWTGARELNRQQYESLPEAEQFYIEMQDNKLLLMGEPERFMNHSCNANTNPGNRCDIAVRNIEINEEITADYGKSYIRGGRMLCNCGQPGCRKVIIGLNGEATGVIQ